MIYYYAPAFTETDGSIAPGKDAGGGVESATTEMPPSLRNLQYDSGAARFVLKQPISLSLYLVGWTIKTKAEVNTDYPGLIP